MRVTRYGNRLTRSGFEILADRIYLPWFKGGQIAIWL